MRKQENTGRSNSRSKNNTAPKREGREKDNSKKFDKRDRTKSNDNEGEKPKREYKPGTKTASYKPRGKSTFDSKKDDSAGKTYSREGRPKTGGFKTSRPSDIKPKKRDDKIRLNRFLSNAGVCSRREADTFISSGCVTVNGKMVDVLGTKVSLEDDVRFNGQILNPQNKIYLLLNKPKGFVTTTDDPQSRKTVMDLVENACHERIYPVGRLDMNTTGLLLFTNDGDLSKRLTHPSHNMKKIYHVFLDKPLTKNHLLEIAHGIELDDGLIAADSISYVKEEDKLEVGIEIHSGKNRIVRRIFEHFGYSVNKLDRVYFAGLTKKNLPRGKWRFLNPIEISQLKML
ncbi:MAG TPA: pseudouridine synthase [Prolixibacteraceae bacterium]|nr:pseudouridine synthase [Prolixibacteraceae bacterium]